MQQWRVQGAGRQAQPTASFWGGGQGWLCCCGLDGALSQDKDFGRPAASRRAQSKVAVGELLGQLYGLQQHVAQQLPASWLS